MNRHAALLVIPSLLLALAPAAPAGAQAMTDGAGAPATLPRPGIALFWAIWCAPCRKESDDLARLKAAAAPLPVVIVPLDADRRTRRALDHVAAADLRFVRANPLGLMQRLTGGAVGLPAAVAIDREGRACAVKHGGVTPADLAAWRRCDGAADAD